MKMTRVMIAMMVTLLLSSIGLAEVKLPVVIGDNMVLQRDMKVPIWGWAAPGEKVTVTFAGKSASAVADAEGNWTVKIGPLTASSAPADMTVIGKSAITLRNILVGEVWLCSGQSNMQWSVKRSLNSKAEITDAKNYPNIRLFTVANITADTPQKDTRGTWAICDARSVEGFSAVGYFFGRQLHNDLKVPVGLIASSWGGTRVEAWTSREAIDSVAFLKKNAAAYDERIRKYDLPAVMKLYEQRLAKWKVDVKVAKAANEKRKAAGKKTKRLPRRPWKPLHPAKSTRRPASLYNGMIAPIIPFAMRGAIWYQGENNAGGAYQYRTAFPLMINDWRERWSQGDFPFLFVQLANFRDVQTKPSAPDAWAFLREAQTMTLSLPKTGMACAIDLADADNPKNIHPKNKQEVGRRLALAARAIAYGQKLVYSGPMYKAGSLKISGAKASLKFDHVGGGLISRGGGLKGFAIAGADKKWVWAKAKIKGNSIILSSPKVSAPVAVRYSWATNPIGTLYNTDGLPASPFRTDDWEGRYGPKE